MSLILVATGTRNFFYLTEHVNGRFWQKGGGYDRNIIKQNTLIESVKYIHNNPVRKALVDEPGKWYYSSYNCWMNGVDEPLRIDKETWPLF